MSNVNCPHCNATLSLVEVAAPAPPAHVDPVPVAPALDVSGWTLRGFTVRLIDLEWPVARNIRTQPLNIGPNEVVLCRLVSPPAGAGPQTPTIQIVQASGWPEAVRTLTLATTPYPSAPIASTVGVAPVIALWSNKAYVPPVFGGRPKNLAVLAPSTIYYLAITQREADGSNSLPVGKLAGLDINFQG